MSAPLRAAAEQILRAAIRAADPRPLTARALRERNAGPAARPVELIAVGKAAAGMAWGAADALGGALLGGVAITTVGSAAFPGHVREFAGGHPLPNGRGTRGARAAERLVRQGARDADVLVLISGGASALMTWPADGIALADVVATTSALMNAGADIRELNCVRKHLDRLKGGLLARAAAGRTVRALVLSDVIGDPLDVIGSGPLVPDPTTYADAIAVLRDRGVWPGLPRAVTAHLLAGAGGDRPETPKAGDPCFANVEIEVVGNNALAVQGAAVEARRRGFEVRIEAAPVAGEAREAGAAFARRALRVEDGRADGRSVCVVGGGETTVTVTGRGRGGRNLEFAAAAAVVIDGASGIAVGSVGTDGRDGPTDAAGAVVDGETALRARLARADLAAGLLNNDSLGSLDAAGAVMRTGPTGTNVADVHVGAIAPLREWFSDMTA